ncbi:MAG: carboxymuconolactone decarboxylase family protein [Verrucomicrobiota bacterium]
MKHTNKLTLEKETQLSAFEQHYGYDASYLRHVLKTSPNAYDAFEHFKKMAAFRQNLSVDDYYVIAIATMQAEDCGSCLQLNVKMAIEAGVSQEIVQAALGRSQPGYDRVQTLRDYAIAVASNLPCEHLESTVRKYLGETGLVELALCVASNRVYPCLKRALGYASEACEMIGIEA